MLLSTCRPQRLGCRLLLHSLCTVLVTVQAVVLSRLVLLPCRAMRCVTIACVRKLVCAKQ